MISFEEQSDGRVYVRTDAATYIDTRENFAADFGKSADALPDGVKERIYVPGKRHALNGDEGTIDGGPVPYPLGDDAIAGVPALLAAQAARQPAPPAPQAPAGDGGMNVIAD